MEKAILEQLVTMSKQIGELGARMDEGFKNQNNKIEDLRNEMNQRFKEQDERIDKKFEEQDKRIDQK